MKLTESEKNLIKKLREERKLREKRVIEFLDKRNWRKIKFEGRKGSCYVVDDGHIYNERGKEIGYVGANGYAVVDRLGYIHRIIWEAFKGKIPEGYEIDHINTIRNDNRLSNLRLVTHKENCNNPLTIEHYKQNDSLKYNRFNGSVNNKKQYIGEYYDASLTDGQNINAMKRYGFEVSLRTLKTWRKENSITKYKKKKIL